MKNKLIYFWLAFLTAGYFFAFTGAGDNAISIGYNAKIVETGSEIQIKYGDTTVTDINRNTKLLTHDGAIAADYFTGSDGISSFDQLWVHSTVGVVEDFYNEGTSKFADYATMDSVYSRTLVTPVGAIATLTGTTATINGISADSVVSTNTITRLAMLRSNSGVTIGKEEAGIYLNGVNLIFAYRDGVGTYYYYYFDMTTGANIEALSYSFSEP